MAVRLLAAELALLNVVVFGIRNGNARSPPLLLGCNVGQTGATIPFNVHFGESDSGTELLGQPSLVNDAIKFVNLLECET